MSIFDRFRGEPKSGAVPAPAAGDDLELPKTGGDLSRIPDDSDVPPVVAEEDPESINILGGNGEDGGQVATPSSLVTGGDTPKIWDKDYSLITETPGSPDTKPEDIPMNALERLVERFYGWIRPESTTDEPAQITDPTVSSVVEELEKVAGPEPETMGKKTILQKIRENKRLVRIVGITLLLGVGTIFAGNLVKERISGHQTQAPTPSAGAQAESPTGPQHHFEPIPDQPKWGGDGDGTPKGGFNPLAPSGEPPTTDAHSGVTPDLENNHSNNSTPEAATASPDASNPAAVAAFDQEHANDLLGDPHKTNYIRAHLDNPGPGASSRIAHEIVNGYLGDPDANVMGFSLTDQEKDIAGSAISKMLIDGGYANTDGSVSDEVKLRMFDSVGSMDQVLSTLNTSVPATTAESSKATVEPVKATKSISIADAPKAVPDGSGLLGPNPLKNGEAHPAATDGSIPTNATAISAVPDGSVTPGVADPLAINYDFGMKAGTTPSAIPTEDNVTVHPATASAVPTGDNVTAHAATVSASPTAGALGEPAVAASSPIHYDFKMGAGQAPAPVSGRAMSRETPASTTAAGHQKVIPRSVVSSVFPAVTPGSVIQPHHPDGDGEDLRPSTGTNLSTNTHQGITLTNVPAPGILAREGWADKDGNIGQFVIPEHKVSAPGALVREGFADNDGNIGQFDLPGSLPDSNAARNDLGLPRIDTPADVHHAEKVNPEKAAYSYFDHAHKIKISHPEMKFTDAALSQLRIDLFKGDPQVTFLAPGGLEEDILKALESRGIEAIISLGNDARARDFSINALINEDRWIMPDKSTKPPKPQKGEKVKGGTVSPDGRWEFHFGTWMPRLRMNVEAQARIVWDVQQIAAAHEKMVTDSANKTIVQPEATSKNVAEKKTPIDIGLVNPPRHEGVGFKAASEGSNGAVRREMGDDELDKISGPLVSPNKKDANTTQTAVGDEAIPTR